MRRPRQTLATKHRLATQAAAADGLSHAEQARAPAIVQAQRYADNDILTAAELREVLRLSPRQWSRVGPMLPCTFVLGRKSPRYIYGEIVSFLKRTSTGSH